MRKTIKMTKYRVTGYMNLHVCIDEEVESDNSLNATDQVYSLIDSSFDSAKVMDCDLDAEVINE